MKIDSMRLVSVLTVLALICTGMVCMVVDDDSSADYFPSNSASNPLTSFNYVSMDIPSGTYTIYVAVGTSFTLIGEPYDGENLMSEILANGCEEFGLHISNYDLKGTITKAGHLHVSIDNEGTNVNGNNDTNIDFYFVEPIVEKYTVSFDSCGGSNNPPSQTVNAGEQITLPDSGTKDGYKFDCWATNPDVGLYIGGIGTKMTPTSTCTVYALWSEDVVVPPVEDKITIVVDGNNVQMDKGKTVGDVTIPTKSGYTFDGWYSDAGLNTPLSNDTVLTDGMNLYSKWTENVVPEERYDHIITYKDGSSILKTQNENNTVNGPVEATISYTPTKDGYTFKGWSPDKDSTSADYQNGDKVSVPVAGLTLYAVWERNVVNVTVDGVSKTFNEGSRVSDIVKPSKPGFEFKGWFSNDTYIDSVSDDTVLTNGMKLYSKMDKIVVPEDKVVVFIDGKNVLMDKGKKVSDIEIPVKDGYTFNGWYSGEELTEEVTGDTVLTNGMTLYSKFTENGDKKDIGGMVLSIMAFVVGIVLIMAGYRSGFPVAMVIGLIIAIFGGVSIGLENTGTDLFTWIKDLFGGKP